MTPFTWVITKILLGLSLLSNLSLAFVINAPQNCAHSMPTSMAKSGAEEVTMTCGPLKMMQRIEEIATASHMDEINEMNTAISSNSRRRLLGKCANVAWTSLASFLATGVPSMANAGLLDEYGADPTKITETKTMASPATAVIPSKKTESDIEPNLRSNYYYPTNKKRYLPRIKKCNDALPIAAEQIGLGNWEAASDFATKIADDTILPLKLYTSSLTGGGTNVRVSYTKTMFQCASDFERCQRDLLRAIQRHDRPASSLALEGMANALRTYRTVGNLLGPDGGGDIPSIDDIRRSAIRNQGRFEQNIMERDLRVKDISLATSNSQ